MNIPITNVFGATRDGEVVVADDGIEYLDCPFCRYVTRRDERRRMPANGQMVERWPRCENPGCTAYYRPDDPPAPAARQAFLDRYHEQALAEDRVRWEKARNAWARQYAEERRREEAAWWAEQQRIAESKGACMACFRRFSSYYGQRVRFVRHRRECPLEGRR